MLVFQILYTRHYNPRFVYFLPLKITENISIGNIHLDICLEQNRDSIKKKGLKKSKLNPYLLPVSRTINKGRFIRKSIKISKGTDISVWADTTTLIYVGYKTQNGQYSQADSLTSQKHVSKGVTEKGQTISKANYGVLNSPKLSFFGRIEDIFS